MAGEKMTWGEFKRRMEEAGATDDSPIHIIEVYKPVAGDDFIFGTAVDSDGEINVA